MNCPFAKKRIRPLCMGLQTQNTSWLLLCWWRGRLVAALLLRHL